MKTMNSLLLAGAVALGFTLTTTAKADEPFLSPKAKEQADSLRKVSGTTPDLIDGSVKSGSLKAIAFAESLRTVPSGATTPNLVSGNYLGAGAKNPHWRMSPPVSVPFIVTSAAMTCEAGCTMACCAKK